MEENQENRRYHDLDFVRAAAMLLGLLLHVCIFFMPPEKYFWASGDYNGDVLNSQFLSFIHLFRMQLFFLLAGFFAELVVDRKGLGKFVGDRLKRILLPFTVGVILGVPIFVLLNGYRGYYTNTYDQSTVFQVIQSMSLFGVFEPDAPLKDNLMHFWFVYYLLIFYFVYTVLRPLLVSRPIQFLTQWHRLVEVGVKKWWGVLLLGLLIAPLQYILKVVTLPPSGFNAPVIDLGLYFLYFLFGVALYRQRELLIHLKHNALIYAAFSVPLFILLDYPSMKVDLSKPVVNDIFTWTVFDLETARFVPPQIISEGFIYGGWSKVLIVVLRTTLCWSMCFASIGLASRYLSNESAPVRYLADSAYWVYWIHLPLTFKLSYMAQSFDGLDALTKCYLVLVFSTLLIYMSYQWCVRYTWMGDFFMGKRKSPDDPGEERFRVANLVKVSAFPVIVGGVFVFSVGSLTKYSRSNNDQAPLVEAYVTRDAEFMKRYETVEGITDAFGNTPLHTSQFAPEGARRYDPIPLLLDRLNTLDHQNHFGRTALFYSVKNGNVGDMKALLDGGADANIADMYGHTAAHAAAILCGHRNQSMAEMYQGILHTLIERGARTDLQDTRGRTVEDCLEQFASLDLPALMQRFER